MNKNISDFKKEVDNLRTRYVESNQKDWLLFAISLNKLAETYHAQGLSDEAKLYKDEYNSIIANVQGPNGQSEYFPFAFACEPDDSDEINKWVEKERESRESLNYGGSITQYAKVVYTLCEFLWPPIQCDNFPIEKERLRWAKIKYKEALDLLLPKQESVIEKERLYMLIVISLKLSECERELNNMDKARNYSLLPLIYWAQNSKEEGMDCDMDFIMELCKTLIKKHQENLR